MKQASVETMKRTFNGATARTLSLPVWLFLSSFVSWWYIILIFSGSQTQSSNSSLTPNINNLLTRQKRCDYRNIHSDSLRVQIDLTLFKDFPYPSPATPGVGEELRWRRPKAAIQERGGGEETETGPGSLQNPTYHHWGGGHRCHVSPRNVLFSFHTFTIIQTVRTSGSLPIFHRNLKSCLFRVYLCP